MYIDVNIEEFYWKTHFSLNSVKIPCSGFDLIPFRSLIFTYLIFYYRDDHNEHFKNQHNEDFWRYKTSKGILKLVETMGFTDDDRYEVKSLSFACCHICNGHHRMGDFDFQSQSGFVRHFRYEIPEN